MKVFKGLLLIVLFTVLAVACSSSQREPEIPETERITPILTLDASCDGSTIKAWRSGTLSDGSKYEIYRPSLWMFIYPKLLFVFAHGYFDPYYPEEPVLPNDYAQDHDALICNLVRGGAAVAWSSYENNGYAVESGFNSTEELRALATGQLKPHHSYLIGHSQGGTIAAKIAEELGSFGGTLALCSPVGGWPAQAQYMGHLRVLFDAYFQNYQSSPTLIPTTNALQPATHVPDDPALIPWTGHYNAGTTSTPLDVIIKDAVLADATSISKAEALAAEPYLRLPYSSDLQLAQSIVDPLYFGVRGTNQTMKIADGSPFGNPDITYSDATKPNPIIRYMPTSDASRQYLKNFYETTGALRSRVLTLHTVHDPVVPFSHQHLYHQKVQAQNKGSLLARHYVRRYGHCAFNDQEIIDGLNALREWHEKGTYPGDWQDATTTISNLELPSADKLPVLEPGPQRLALDVSGEGSVSSSPNRLDCTETCEGYFGFGTEVTLTAAPAEGKVFAGWSGACSGTETCSLSMTADVNVTATFADEASEPPPASTYQLTVTLKGNGSGQVTGDGIDCPGDCSETFAKDATVTLTATPASGSSFGGWTGCDSVTGTTCEVTMNNTKEITATFNKTRGGKR